MVQVITQVLECTVTQYIEKGMIINWVTFPLGPLQSHDLSLSARWAVPAEDSG